MTKILSGYHIYTTRLDGNLKTDTPSKDDVYRNKAPDYNQVTFKRNRNKTTYRHSTIARFKLFKHWVITKNKPFPDPIPSLPLHSEIRKFGSTEYYTGDFENTDFYRYLKDARVDPNVKS